MVRSVRATYENGVFHPLDAVEGLPERAAVNLRVEALFCTNRLAGRFRRPLAG